MTAADRRKVLSLVALMASLVSPVAWAGETAFSSKPTVARDGDKIKISFAVSAPTDVEVAILGADGKVVRHLAAGSLGGAKPPPEPLKAGLVQTIEWDRKDDYGRPATGGPFKIRMRAGLSAKVGGFIGDAEVPTGHARQIPPAPMFGMVMDDAGRIYVGFREGPQGLGAHSPTIKVFDRDGKYLRTIMPYPSSLKIEDVDGFAKHTPRDGRLNPPILNPWAPLMYTDNVNGFVGSRVKDGAITLISGSGRLCRIRASDGACLDWGGAQVPLGGGGLGPVCWAESPDGKTLYLSGWKPANKPDGVVYRVDPVSFAATEFIRIDVPPNSFWLTDRNQWYVTGRSAMCALHGVAVDKEGNVYVCDRVNQRLAVYDSKGTLLGFTPMEWPDLVLLSPKSPEVYVLTRKDVNGHLSITETRLLKLSGSKNGRVLAEINIPDTFGPARALLDATRDPPVIWHNTTRIEDRGKELVITGRLGEKARPMIPLPVKVWADPMNDNIIISDGWYGLFCFNGLTGEPQPWPLTGIDLAFDRDGNYYVCGERGEIYHGPVSRYDRQFKPLPFPATGKNGTAGRAVYARIGIGYSNKGLAVGPDGRILAYSMYDWCAYFVHAWDAAGNPEKNARCTGRNSSDQKKELTGGLIGPVDSHGGGLCVDLKGNIYVGMQGWPKGTSGDRSDGKGTVVKFGPSGGGYVQVKADKPGLEWWSGSREAPKVSFLEGGLVAYPGLALQPVVGGCTCKEVRFDIDGYGRVYVPNALEYCIRVFDNAGNEIAKWGYYGNPDSRGPGSLVPEPEIPIGFPTSVSAGQLDKGRLYVSDQLNHRIMRLDLSGRIEVTCEVK